MQIKERYYITKDIIKIMEKFQSIQKQFCGDYIKIPMYVYQKYV